MAQENTTIQTGTAAQTYNLPPNFRDLGGLVGADGRKVRPKRLLRCGELSKMTDEDIRGLIEDYDLKNVVDLRTNGEREKEPDHLLPEVAYYVRDFFGDNDAANGSMEQFMQLKSTDELHQLIRELYGSFVTDARVLGELRQFFDLLLETEEGATLFHCTAGKDRTGSSAAFILSVLGVSREDIMEDYLLTNVMRKELNEVIIEQMRQSGVPEKLLPLYRIAFGVDRSYLEYVFEVADREYGTMENFLQEGVGITPEQAEKLREMYLEK